MKEKGRVGSGVPIPWPLFPIPGTIHIAAENFIDNVNGAADIDIAEQHRLALDDRMPGDKNIAAQL